MSENVSSLYQKYLLADTLMKRIESCGATTTSIGFADKFWEEHEIVGGEADERYSFMHSVSCAPEGLVGAEKRETFTEQWLSTYPETKLVRHEGSIYLRGTTYAGLTWLVSVGTGVCERVQVGTKKVMKIDPDYLVDAPLVEVSEPIFEVRCGDPLREMVESVKGEVFA